MEVDSYGTLFYSSRDLYHGKGALEALEVLHRQKAMICVGGGSMKRLVSWTVWKGYLKKKPAWKSSCLKASSRTLGRDRHARC